MTLPGALDWQEQIAETAFLLASQSVNTGAVVNLDITATLLPQHMAIAIAIVWHPANACRTVDWQLFDRTLGTALLLDSAQSEQQPNMQVMPFPGAYASENPANTLQVQFVPDGSGNLVADLYVYGLTSMPLMIPQTRLADRSVLLDSGPVNIPAGTTGNVLAQATPGFVNRVKLLAANHTLAAAAVARVSWIDQFGLVPHFETLDTAVANFVWNNIVDFDNVVGLSYVNGSTQPHRVMVAYEQIPQ